MDLETPKLIKLSSRWIDAAANGTLPDVFSRDVTDWREIKEISVIEFRRNASPALLNEMDDQTGDPNLESYLSSTYLVDPFYNAFLRGDRWGFSTLEELLPDWEELREPWSDYQALAHMQDECGYLIPVSQDVAINVAFVRVSGSRFFGDFAIEWFSRYYPLVESLFRTYWNLHHEVSGLATRQAGFSRVNSLLGAFGTSLLTRREQEMVQLLLKGYSAKLIAEAMHISPGTVNVHRANIYSKMDINSYKELFSLFINAISSVEVEEGEDIYAAYCRTPAS